jgi:hypothetical protein
MQFEFLLSPPLTAKVKLVPLSEGTPPRPTLRVSEDGLRSTSDRSLPTEAPRKNHTPTRPSAEALRNKRWVGAYGKFQREPFLFKHLRYERCHKIERLALRCSHL